MMAKFAHIDGKDVLHMRFADGEVLEMHEHMLPTYHDVAVVCGRASVYGANWCKEVSAGETLLLTDGEMHHEIKALEPDTEVLNVYRLPMPRLAATLGTEWKAV
jgi:hypothetical protein